MARSRQQQRAQDQLIPHNVWEADEARRRARRDHSVDSDVSTVGNKSGVSNQDNDPEDPEIEETLEETISAGRRPPCSGASSCLATERQLLSTMTR